MPYFPLISLFRVLRGIVHTLSVIIITKNEASRIRQCLESVKFADEIILIDSESTDTTVAIAKEYTEKVFQQPWLGFGVTKNIALSRATSDWILAVDADEIVSENLKTEIQDLLATTPKFNAYFIPRQSTYCNQALRFGDWKNDQCLRLFKKGDAKFKEVPVHEELIVNCVKGKLQNYLIHHSFPAIEDVIEKINRYSTLSAQHKFNAGKKSSLLTAISHGLWTFLRGYIFRLGFLDGKKGFLLAVSNAEGCYYRYVKIMLLEEKSS